MSVQNLLKRKLNAFGTQPLTLLHDANEKESLKKECMVRIVER